MTLKPRPACIPGEEWLDYSNAVTALYAVMRRNRAKGLIAWAQGAPHGGFGEAEFALAADVLTAGERALLFEDLTP